MSTSGTLSAHEQSELRDHLVVCPECRQVHNEYRALTSEAIPLLAQVYETPDILADWDSASVRSRLLAGLDRQTKAPSAVHSNPLQRSRYAFLAAVAACLLFAVGVGAYQAGKYRAVRGLIAPPIPVAQTLSPLIEKQNLEGQLRDSLTATRALQQESAKEQAEADKLQSQIREMSARISELNALDLLKDEHAQALLSERDALAQQLLDAQENYKTVEDELGRYRNQQSEALVRTASLESEVKRLSERLSEQDRTLREREEYLASDRDIRELMGARQLYIADVYDVDKTGRSRKAYGRIFYTVDKSLVFYAFDLDQGAALKNSTFQAWGRNDLVPGKSVSLGIFYMDSVVNRRWVLRTDDPAKIAQINAIFVTVEPGRGSKKPSGKPFLYASLRQAPNHP